MKNKVYLRHYFILNIYRSETKGKIIQTENNKNTREILYKIVNIIYNISIHLHRETVNALQDQLKITDDYKQLVKENHYNYLIQYPHELPPSSENTDIPQSKEDELKSAIDEEKESLISSAHHKQQQHNVKSQLTKKERINKLKRQEENSYKQFIQEANKDSWIDFIGNLGLVIVRAFLPFKNDLKYIYFHYNTTILTLFEIIRFFFAISLVGVIVYIFLIIYHFANYSKQISKSGKYGMPSVFLYSSYTTKEYQAVSFTYGIWQIFFFFGFVMFYYISRSAIYRNEAYLRSNKYFALSSYIFTSWDFNYNNNLKANAYKKEIDILSSSYLEEYKDKLKNYNKCCKCNCSSSIGRLISYAAFCVIIVVMFFIMAAIFSFRSSIRSELIKAEEYKIKDVLADLIPLIIQVIIVIGMPYLLKLLTYMEVQKPRGKMLSNAVKKVIFVVFFVFTMIYSEVMMILNEKDIVPNMNNFIQGSTYGCPGNYSKLNLTDTDTNITEYNTTMNVKTHSIAKEDEMGLNFFFLALLYYGCFYVKELFALIIYSMCKRCGTRQFQPFDVLIHVHLVFVLFSVVVFYMPFFIVLFPFIFLIEFKYNYGILKKQASFKYDEVTVTQRNNAHDILSWFFSLGLLGLVVTLYFYLRTFNGGAVGSVCKTNGTVSVRIPNQVSLMVQDGLSLSSIMTMKMSQTPLIMWFHNIFSSSVVIFMFLFSLLGMALYKNYAPSEEYYETMIKKERKLVGHVEVMNEHIAKRDAISAMLVKLVKRKELKEEHQKKKNVNS